MNNKEEVKYCLKYVKFFLFYGFRLVHDYTEEVHFNDEFAPNYDDEEVETNWVDDDVQVRSENVEDEVQVGSKNDEDEVQGLVPAVQSVSAHVEQRLCVKHLYGIWKKKYPGLELKEVNNMCEDFNMEILESRDKPIITMLEGIKHYLTKRITSQKDALSKYNGDICPRIQYVLEKNKKVVENWTPTWHGDDDLSIYVMRRAIGLPKKMHNKVNDEPRNPHVLHKKLPNATCHKCGAMAYNKRSFKGKRVADKAIPKGGNASEDGSLSLTPHPTQPSQQ
ncbi:hypothetical protein KIW84_073819 [Lathyrus oleraceus]|uniref:Uncharacterized protein n=1 Tax=Pisum sativum TaxID=3888 RepID=A0A9D4VPN9_PEA|nr:hypothetical protein KIW84_073819 [Pisum sativum]